MKLKIVTTTYNQKEYIEEAINSFLMQETNFQYKIVISDDCSTDGTREILKQYSEKYPEKFEIIFNERNLGAMENFINTFSNVKDAEYVALCDGDDFWTDKNKLQKQVDFLDKNKEFNICFHKAKLFFQEGEKESNIIPQFDKEVTTIKDLVEQNYIVANSVVYRWKFNNRNLKEIFPKDIVPGDYYMHLLHAEDGKIKMFDEVMSCYRRHKDGMWWSNEKDREKFSIQYGKKFLNFFKAANDNMKLPKNAFAAQRKGIIYDMIVAYTKNDMLDKLYQDINTDIDKKAYQECMKDIVNRNIWFLDYLKSKEQYNPEEELNRIKESKWWKIGEKVRKIYKH